LVAFLRKHEKLKGVAIPELQSTWKQADEKKIKERKSQLEFVLNSLLKRSEVLEL